MDADKSSIVVTENVVGSWVVLILKGGRDDCFVAEKIFHKEKVDDPFFIL
jgi:hypothetical protein